MAYIITSIALVFFTGHALKWLFIKTKIPDILLLIMIGFILGPVLGLIQVEDFGKVGSVITTLALVVILYDGGLNLNAKDLLSSSLPALLISVLGAAFIGIIGFALAYSVGQQPWHISLLFALGIGSTSSAVVIPMVKFLSVSERVKTILSLESAFTDVLAIVCFLVVADGITENRFSIQEIIVGIGPKTLTAVLLGVAFGFGWALLRNSFRPLTTMTFAGEAWALFTFGLIELLGFNGAMGVLALGFTLANLSLLPDSIKKVFTADVISKEEISLLGELAFLLKTIFFIYLGILIKFADPLVVFFSFIVALCIFVTRYLCLKILFRPSQYSRQEAMAITAMGPRGLAAAVLASIPMQMNIAGGEFVQNAIFALIPFSIIFTAIFVMLSEKEAWRKKFEVLFLKYQEGPRAESDQSEPEQNSNP